MAYTPYQIAGTQSSLIDALRQGRQGSRQSQFATRKQMGKMREKYQDELEAAQERARKKAKKHGGFFKGLNILGSLLGPLGAGITKGIAGLGQAQQQRRGARELLDVDEGRYSRNFLRNPMREYMEQAKEAQLSSGDVLRSGVGAGIQGFATSKMLGGSKETGGIFKKMGKAKKAKAALPGIEEQALKTVGVGADSLSLQDEITKQLGLKGYGGVSQQALTSGAPRLSELIQSFKGFSKGQGLQGATDEMQSAIMLPMLLQLMMGGSE